MPQFAALVEDIRGQPISDPDPTNKDRKMTLARACEVALDASLQDDQAEPLSKKLKRGQLVDKIYHAANGDGMKILDLPAEDIALLKERVGKVFTVASIIRKICKMLDEATE